MNTQLLAQLGFSDKEILVYLAILKHGKLSPANVARITKMKRTTAYSIAEELIKKGVVNVDLSSKTKNLLALPPEELENVIEKEERLLEQKRKLIPEIVQELKEYTQATRYVLPKVTFIGEEELEQYLHRQTPIWNASLKKTDPIWWGFQDDSFVEHYGSWIEWYWKEGTEPGISLQLLSNDSATEKEMAKKNFVNRTIKFWGETSNFTGTTWVTGNHLIMIQTAVHPHFLVEVVDSTLAHNQREVFKGIWKGLPK
ncbi:MAG TPA: helix-turn-helix domain-containing protein [Verrucomicrobiae bacterium]|nr:helix-turn-helix domain-containing protein [Verrucomicrobiae bacterium]